MTRTILVMAGGTGGHIFSSGVTRAMHALACTEDVTVVAVGVVTL
jgi:hypothetical protein